MPKPHPAPVAPESAAPTTSVIPAPAGAGVVLQRNAEADEALWRTKVLERHHHACGNCGSTDRVQVHFSVPLAAGGTLAVTNGYVLCRACEMACEIAKKPSGAARRPINFWVSKHLYDLLDSLTAPGRRFSSMGGLIRYLITLYTTSPGRFDDLPNYQDRGTDMKVNAWVDRDAYETFKALLDTCGVTVTDALKGLILLYSEMEPVTPDAPASAKDNTDE